MRPHSGETKIFALAVHWQTIMGSASESECHRIVIRSNDNSQHHAALHSADCSLHKKNVLGLFSNSHCSELHYMLTITNCIQKLFEHANQFVWYIFFWIGKKGETFLLYKVQPQLYHVALSIFVFYFNIIPIIKFSHWGASLCNVKIFHYIYISFFL